MSLPPFQRQVAQFVAQHELEISVGDRLLDLTSEVGELAKEVLKATSYGRQDFLADPAWADELGDVFFACICLANSTNVNLLEALATALDKYQTRLACHGEAGSKNKPGR